MKKHIKNLALAVMLSAVSTASFAMEKKRNLLDEMDDFSNTLADTTMMRTEDVGKHALENNKYVREQFQAVQEEARKAEAEKQKAKEEVRAALGTVESLQNEMSQLRKIIANMHEVAQESQMQYNLKNAEYEAALLGCMTILKGVLADAQNPRGSQKLDPKKLSGQLKEFTGSVRAIKGEANDGQYEDLPDYEVTVGKHEKIYKGYLAIEQEKEARAQEEQRIEKLYRERREKEGREVYDSSSLNRSSGFGFGFGGSDSVPQFKENYEEDDSSGEEGGKRSSYPSLKTTYSSFPLDTEKFAERKDNKSSSKKEDLTETKGLMDFKTKPEHALASLVADEKGKEEITSVSKKASVISEKKEEKEKKGDSELSAGSYTGTAMFGGKELFSGGAMTSVMPGKTAAIALSELSSDQQVQVDKLLSAKDTNEKTVVFQNGGTSWTIEDLKKGTSKKVQSFENKANGKNGKIVLMTEANTGDIVPVLMIDNKGPTYNLKGHKGLRIILK